MQSTTSTLLNNLVTNADNAYAGRVDPMSNAQQQGVTQIYLDTQRMATLMVGTK